MKILLIAKATDGVAVPSHSAARHWLALLYLGVACTLQGCNSPPAPSPTANPHPTHTLKLKINIEKGAEVNRVEVQSLWVVGNLSCAPSSGPQVTQGSNRSRCWNM